MGICPLYQWPFIVLPLTSQYCTNFHLPNLQIKWKATRHELSYIAWYERGLKLSHHYQEFYMKNFTHKSLNTFIIRPSLMISVLNLLMVDLDYSILISQHALIVVTAFLLCRLFFGLHAYKVKLKNTRFWH